MTATDWRTHDTAEFRSAFQDAQLRLDEADIREDGNGYCAPGVEHYTSEMVKADEELTDRYDRLVLQPAQYEFERQCDEDEFAACFPEPADGARVEFEADGGTLYGAFREDDDQDGKASPARWYLYGTDETLSWRDLICRFELYPDAITVLPDGDLPAGSGDVDLLVFDQLLADGCTVLPAPLAPSVFEEFWAEYEVAS